MRALYSPSHSDWLMVEHVIQPGPMRAGPGTFPQEPAGGRHLLPWWLSWEGATHLLPGAVLLARASLSLSLLPPCPSRTSLAGVASRAWPHSQTFTYHFYHFCPFDLLSPRLQPGLGPLLPTGAPGPWQGSPSHPGSSPCQWLRGVGGKRPMALAPLPPPALYCVLSVHLLSPTSVLFPYGRLSHYPCVLCFPIFVALSLFLCLHSSVSVRLCLAAPPLLQVTHRGFRQLEGQMPPSWIQLSCPSEARELGTRLAGPWHRGSMRKNG
ncbi:hypothetical protein H1C71_007611 [Ictidomys tridecemlineatus]|nr:hypothetical protein H1C71_007611 [Ictidomys tridecemlineatus]